MLRIIAGQYRSRRLATPEGQDTRPTLDRVREALFNILGDRVVESRFIDLFAGSGAIGLEALSRGASHVTFVETALPAVRALRSNIESLKISASEFTIVHQDALTYLRAAVTNPADILFADPPYSPEALVGLLAELIPQQISAEGLIVIQHFAKDSLPAPHAGLTITDQRTYGKSSLSFLQPAD